MSTKLEKVTAAMADQEFVAKIVAMEDPEDVKAAFAEKDIEFSLDEISQMAKMIESGNVDELDESQLESVAGGVDPVTVTVVVCGIIKLGADVMSTINSNRKAKGKKTIW